jgi:hypothetical protein
VPRKVGLIELSRLDSQALDCRSRFHLCHIQAVRRGHLHPLLGQLDQIRAVETLGHAELLGPSLVALTGMLSGIHLNLGRQAGQRAREDR